MTIANIILNQLGGGRFIAMTGAHHLVSNGASLRMQLPRNGSKANRLTITLGGDDLYTMRFWRYTPPRISLKNGRYYDEKVTEVKQYDGVYADMLQDLFTRVTGLYTRL